MSFLIALPVIIFLFTSLLSFLARTRAVKISKSWGKKKGNGPYVCPGCSSTGPFGILEPVDGSDCNERYLDSPASFPAPLTMTDAADSGSRVNVNVRSLISAKESSQQISIDELSTSDVDRMCESVLLRHPMQKKVPTPAEALTCSRRCPLMANKQLFK